MAYFNQSYTIDLTDAASEAVIDARTYLTGSIQTTLVRSSGGTYNGGGLSVKVSNSGVHTNGDDLGTALDVTADGILDITGAVRDYGYVHLVSDGAATSAAEVRVDVVLKSSESTP